MPALTSSEPPGRGGHRWRRRPLGSHSGTCGERVRDLASSAKATSSARTASTRSELPLQTGQGNTVESAARILQPPKTKSSSLAPSALKPGNLQPSTLKPQTCDGSHPPLHTSSATTPDAVAAGRCSWAREPAEAQGSALLCVLACWIQDLLQVSADLEPWATQVSVEPSQGGCIRLPCCGVWQLQIQRARRRGLSYFGTRAQVRACARLAPDPP